MSSVQGVFFVTAMAAVSGTAVFLLALKLHRYIPPPPPPPVAEFQPHPPRPCISSGKKKAGKEKKKRVSFAEDVVEPTGNSEEFRRRLQAQIHRKSASAAAPASVKGVRGIEMPANRVALYNGILRARMMHRLGCSY